MSNREEENNKQNEDTSSVIDEALMDAEKIQEYIKENTKSMLRSTVGEEVKKEIKGSLNEEEEDDYEEEEVEGEEDEEEGEGGEEDEEEISLGDEGEDEEGGGTPDLGGEELGGGEGGEEIPDLGGEEEAGGEETQGQTFDYTQAPQDEVWDVYKKLNNDDEIEVVDDNTYKITDPESGNEYLFKRDGEGGEEESELEVGEEMPLESNMTNESEEPIYEIEIDEDRENTNPKRGAGKETHEMGELSKASEETPSEERTGVVEDEEEVNEDKPRKAGHDPRDQVKGASAPEDIEKASSPTDNQNHGSNLEGGFPEEESTKDGAGHHAEHVMEDGDVDDLDLESIAEELGEEEEDAESDSRSSEKAKGTRDLGNELETEVNEAGEQEYDYSKSTDYRDEKGNVPGEQATGPDERTSQEKSEEQDVEEGGVRAYNNGRNQSTKPQNFPKQRMAGRDDHFQQARGIGESQEDINKVKKKYNKLLGEAKKLQKENKKFKSSLNKFRDMLAETAVFNSNLSFATRLFMEHSVTGEEKEKIIERFDKEANTLKESKELYQKINNELENKEPLNENVKKKIEPQPSSSNSNALNETNAYADKKEFGRMKQLMGINKNN